MLDPDPDFGVMEVAVELRIAAPPARVWQALLHETSYWWQRDYYTGTAPRGFVLEERLGGHGYEDWGEGQGQIWFTVTGLQRHAYLQLSGTMGAEYGPVTFVTAIRLRADAEGTLLRLHDCHFGRVDAEKPSGLEDGWRLLLGGLADWVERGVLPDLPPTVAVPRPTAGKKARGRGGAKAGRAGKRARR